MSTVATPGEWQCKIRTGGVRRLAVANGPNIFQMLLVNIIIFRPWYFVPRDEKNCATHREKLDSWNGPYSSFSFTLLLLLLLLVLLKRN